MTTASAQHEEIRSAAEQLYADKVDWTVFYSKVMGLRGVIRRHFPTVEAMAKFKNSDAYLDIQRMLAELRKRSPAKPKKLTAEDGGDIEPNEETRVITVRIPKSMHEALQIEAYEHHTSMNKLCISKLLQHIENDSEPTPFGGEKVEADL
jgi:predicted HicB family RNase H-like nuclease